MRYKSLKPPKELNLSQITANCLDRIVNQNENYYEAALRELKEETSIVSVELIKEIEKKLAYILPDHLVGIIWI